MNTALDLTYALDPVAWAKGLAFIADDWQAGVLRSIAPQLVMNCSRQSGKSVTAALLALHLSLYSPGSLILLLSPTLRQSSELFRKVIEFYDESVPSDSETKLTLELVNGSRIVSLPGKEETVRSYSGVALLVVDEASRVDDELYYAVRPMLAVSGGRLVLLSTPFGKRGYFYETWIGGKDWERVKILADECLRISAEFLARERDEIGDWWYRQEYECEFLDLIGSMFTHDEIEEAFTGDVEPFFV